jgi:drug/metabolite transporter (DMT)-like permease
MIRTVGTKDDRLAYAALLLGVLCIGGSALFVKLAGVPGPVAAFYRFLFPCLVLLPWWLASGRSCPSGPELKQILTGGLYLAGDLALWNTSIMLTTAATATLLGNNAPIWVGLISMLIFRERLGSRYWTGLLLAMLGMLLIAFNHGVQAAPVNVGYPLAVASSLFFAGYLITTRKLRASIDTLTFMTFSSLVSMAILLCITLAMGLPLTGYSLRSWGSLIGLGLISHLLGYLSINFALGHLRASVVSVTLLGQPLVTALLAMPVLGEFLAPWQIAGGCLVLAGIYRVNTCGNKPVEYVEDETLKTERNFDGQSQPVA